MTVDEPPETASQWASTVSRRRYRKHRVELDALVMASVPGYAAKVDQVLGSFVEKVRDGRERYDVEHDVARLMRPLTPTVFTSALWWISLLGGIVAFATLVARARSVSHDVIDTDVRVMLAGLMIAAGVAAQLIRALPIRLTVPPRRDPAWISTAFGVVAFAIMVAEALTDERVDVLWIAVAGIALAASGAYAIPYVIARRRDRALAARVDAMEEDRLVAASDRLERLADECADALEELFLASPTADQRTMELELARATRVLRDRGIIGTPASAGAGFIRRRTTRYLRPMFPGFLLLEKLVQEVWDPAFSEPQDRRNVNWFVTEYLPKRGRAIR